MIVKTKKVYYCEHCGRHRLTASSIEKHEKGCTLNPHRSCGVCNNSDIENLLIKYKDSFVIDTCVCEDGYRTETPHWTGEHLTLKDLRSDAEDCPVCILAVIRQCNLNRSPGDFTEYDYRDEHKEYWRERNAEYGYSIGEYQ